MDEYYLSKKDWDIIIVGDRRDDIVCAGDQNGVYKEVSTMWNVDVIKYTCISSHGHNSTEHPIAFHKALDLGGGHRRSSLEDLCLTWKKHTRFVPL
ncbi:hypothetical protein F5887DRAFT_953922 [Amanita rubescens]|nr:hypothetical protein F5887DRAFT_953922 [Amanita rubescens]